MNNFYVKDGKQVKYLNTVPEVVAFLELVIKEKTKMTRSQWMQHNMDLGHGPDDENGKNFVDSMQELVEIGVVRGKKCIRCSIFEATMFTDPAYGD
jgi:hypothetical protein